MEIGDIVIATKTITAGLFCSEVLAEEGEELMYEGKSTNSLHSRAVSKIGNRLNAFSLSYGEFKKKFIFKIGDECVKEDGEVIIIDSLPDEFTRINYSVKNTHGGGHMGYNHWKLLKAI